METEYILIKEFISKFKFEDNDTTIGISRTGEIIIIFFSYCGYEDGSDIKYQIKILNKKYEVVKFESTYSVECGFYESEDLNCFDDINAVIDYLSKEF